MVLWGVVVAPGPAVSWVKLALSICFFGLQAFLYAVIAQDKKPLFGSRRIVIVGGQDDGLIFVVCEFRARLSVAMGSLSLVSLLLAILVGHLAVLYPYTNSNTSPTPTRALLRSTKLIVFFLVAQLVSASALAMLLGATVTQARHAKVQYQLHQAPATCTLNTDGHFGGAALLALDAALMWFVCQLLALEARADYLHLHHHHHPHDIDDDDHHRHAKKMNIEQDVATALDP